MSASVLVGLRAITCNKTLFAGRQILKTFSTAHLGKVPVSWVRNFSVNSCKNMKLCQFVYNDKPTELRAGITDGVNVLDLHKADNSLPTTILEILKNGFLENVKNITDCNCYTIPLSNVTLKAPITGMDKVLCVGLNYKDHCEEQKLTPPEVPMIFGKFASCVIGPNEPVRLRTDVTQQPVCEIELAVVIGKAASRVKASEAYNYVLGYTIAQDIGDFAWYAKNLGQLILGKKVDWEVELVVVIGKTASYVKAQDALNYVVGTTVAQDISARDWQKQRNAGQFLLGKAMDTFCPIGPWIVTRDETGDIENLDIQCAVNGVLKQKSNTNQFVHKIPAIIERVSSVMTLLPGDIILTGTPGGVGMYRDPPEYLQPGDVITSVIQNIGTLETPCKKF